MNESDLKEVKRELQKMKLKEQSDLDGTREFGRILELVAKDMPKAEFPYGLDDYQTLKRQFEENVKELDAYHEDHGYAATTEEKEIYKKLLSKVTYMIHIFQVALDRYGKTIDYNYDMPSCVAENDYIEWLHRIVSSLPESLSYPFDHHICCLCYMELSCFDTLTLYLNEKKNYDLI